MDSLEHMHKVFELNVGDFIVDSLKKENIYAIRKIPNGQMK